MDMISLLSQAIKQQASDLHLVVGVPPSIRVNGEIVFMDYPGLTPEMTHRLTCSLLSPAQRERLEKEREIDLSVDLPEIGRCRVNAYHAKGAVECALRIIPSRIRTLEELGLPEVVKELALRPKGLVLVAGAAGMGKTTTLAAMIDYINQHKRSRIITIEDPIEYLHEHKKSIVVQREIGTDPTSDTRSFASALRNALRQDPNVICIGEMRDLDTFAIAMTAAETGHLVMGTIHTANAIHTISRIIDVFPPYQQPQIRTQLADCLEAVVAQLLLPRMDGNGRVLATEILVATGAIRRCIRDNKLEQIITHLQTGGEFQMKTMDLSLRELYEAGLIDYDTAISKAQDPRMFRDL